MDISILFSLKIVIERIQIHQNFQNFLVVNLKFQTQNNILPKF
jgi:hypothetical protein